jgi:DNA-binding winged helix-turn-helix (wHTH) protein/tetratricopeptide (TPR) repeat protein
MPDGATHDDPGRAGRASGGAPGSRGAGIFAFGEHELDGDRFELRRHGVRVPVQPKPLALLLYLARHHARLVPRDELVGYLWPDVVVSDDALFHAVKMAREAVGDRGSRQCVIETVRGVGFRFAAALAERSGRAPWSAGGAERALPPLLGREMLLGRLLPALDAAARGRGGVVLLEGEAGVGKTRLLDAIGEVARQRGLRVLRGGCRKDGGPAFAPWSQALEDLFAASSDAELAPLADPGVGPWIAALVPSLLDRFPALAAVAADARDGESRWRQFAAVSRVLAAAARSRPLVVLLDDLHWADPATLRLVEHLVPELHGHAVLLVGAHRDERAEPSELLSILRGEISRHGAGEALRVERLSREEVASLLAALLGAPPAPPLAAAVYERTSGNPFFVVEMAHDLAPRMADAHSGIAFVRACVPEAVRQVVKARLARLPERTRDVLSLAAVSGGEFEVSIVQRAAGHTSGEVLDALEEALGVRLLEEVPGAAGRLRFAHALIHDAIASDLAELRRARLHLALGDALEAQEGGDAPPAAALARHLCGAVPLATRERAARWSMRAAQEAMQRLAYEEAAGHYERAASLVDPETLAPEARFDLLFGLGRARHYGLGDFVRARESFRATAAVARGLRDPARLAEAALAHSGIPQSSLTEVEGECCAALEEALAAQPAGAAVARARLLARLAAFLASEPRRQAEAVELATQAVAAARNAGDPHAILETLLPLNRALRLQGTSEPERRVAITAESTALGAATGDAVLETLAHGQRVSALLELGLGAEADAEVDRYAALAGRLRMPALYWIVPVLRAMQQLRRGELDAVERTALGALPIARSVPGSVAPDVLAVLLYVLRREQGRLAEGEAPTRELAERYPRHPGPRAWLALLLAEAGRANEARRELEDVVSGGLDRLAGTEGWRACLAMLAEACVALGDVERAAALQAELAPVARHCLVLGDGILCLGPAARVLGSLAALRSRFDEAEAHFERARELCESLASPLWAARTRLDHARALARRGRPADRDRAALLLGEAARAAAALGLPCLAQQVRAAQASSA